MANNKPYQNNKWTTVGTYKNIHKPPHLAGVYIIFIDDYSNDTRTIQYVGQTADFYKRFSCHRTYFKIRDIILGDYVKSITVKVKPTDIKTRKELEKRLIQKLKPPYNKFYNWGYL